VRTHLSEVAPVNRRVQADVDIQLTIVLDGEPGERTAAYDAFLDDALETLPRLGLRYYLRGAERASERSPRGGMRND
jgi:hypothetical protein